MDIFVLFDVVVGVCGGVGGSCVADEVDSFSTRFSS
jgi:hypothetical protein